MNLLFVCQANILRSAAAQALAQAMAPADTTWNFTSAGTRALVGHAMHPDVAAALANRGVTAEPHRSRQLTPRLLQAADLVLTFENGQRTWAIRQQPRAARKVLTIRRAARLLASDLPQQPAAAFDPAPTFDLLHADAKPYRDDDTFDDPIGQGTAAVTAAVDEIATLLQRIIPYL